MQVANPTGVTLPPQRLCRHCTWYVLTTILLTPAALWMGVTAMSAMMVEQLGLAMMPPLPALCPFKWSALTSGMIRGTPSVMRKAELLSTTCAQNNKGWQKSTYRACEAHSGTLDGIILSSASVMLKPELQFNDTACIKSCEGFEVEKVGTALMGDASLTSQIARELLAGPQSFRMHITGLTASEPQSCNTRRQPACGHNQGDGSPYSLHLKLVVHTS